MNKRNLAFVFTFHFFNETLIALFPCSLQNWSNISRTEMCIYDKGHINSLRIENTSESDLCSYEATKAVVKKAQKTSEASKAFEPMSSVIPVQCSTN